MLFLFAPGAGAPSSSPWMRSWAERLSTLGAVIGFDYPYQIQGRKSPDRPPVLITAHRKALQEARARVPGPYVLVGKSMGSRIGCHVALVEATKPAALVCFGYPLVGQSGAVRDQVLLELETPILFVQGTRDPLCPLDRLEAVRARMQATNELFVVEGGDHSLAVARTALKTSGTTQAEVDAGILSVVADFTKRNARS